MGGADTFRHVALGSMGRRAGLNIVADELRDVGKLSTTFPADFFHTADRRISLASTIGVPGYFT